MKKYISFLLILSVFISMMATAFASENTGNSEKFLQENNFTVISNGESIAEGVETATLGIVDSSVTDENFLFEASSFEVALQKPEDIKKMILNGNTIAVFGSNGADQAYDNSIGLPIGFEDEKESMAENGITVGRIYRTDSVGNLHIARVRVDPEFGDENAKFDEFVRYLERFMKKNGSRSTNSGSMDFLGSVTDYFTGASKKGDIDATYEVSTVQAVGGYDYYTVHGYIDYTPGDALYSNGYDVDEFQSIMQGSGLDVNLYKTGPNTMLSVNEYSVDVGFTASKDGVEMAFGAGWSGEVPDVSIYKNKTNESTCIWEVDVNDHSAAADHTISFEPGGTFRAKSSRNKLYVHTQNELTVDSFTESPSRAVIGDLRFYCSAQGVEER